MRAWGDIARNIRRILSIYHNDLVSKNFIIVTSLNVARTLILASENFDSLRLGRILEDPFPFWRNYYQIKNILLSTWYMAFTFWWTWTLWPLNWFYTLLLLPLVYCYVHGKYAHIILFFVSYQFHTFATGTFYNTSIQNGCIFSRLYPNYTILKNLKKFKRTAQKFSSPWKVFRKLLKNSENFLLIEWFLKTSKTFEMVSKKKYRKNSEMIVKNSQKKLKESLKTLRIPNNSGNSRKIRKMFSNWGIFKNVQDTRNGL